MASCTAAASCMAGGLSSLKPTSRRSGVASLVQTAPSWRSRTAAARSVGKVRCDGASTQLIVTLSTGSLLFLGRFVFLPFQRRQIARAGLPTQNGVTHLEAGDTRAAEVSSLMKTGDPAGFTIVDVLAWGALGHAVAYFILATASNGYDPQF